LFVLDMGSSDVNSELCLGGPPSTPPRSGRRERSVACQSSSQSDVLV